MAVLGYRGEGRLPSSHETGLPSTARFMAEGPRTGISGPNGGPAAHEIVL
jgi:hypothetical protein